MSDLYGLDDDGRRRPVRRDLTDELRAMRAEGPPTAPARKRPTKIVVHNHTPPAPNPGPAEDVPIVPPPRGVALAQRLRESGIVSARWAKSPHADRWELSVAEADHERAAAVLADLAAQEQPR